MNKNLLIGALMVLITALLLNMFYGWFTLDRAERIAKEAQEPKTDTITLTEYVTKDSLVYVNYQANEGELLANNVTKNYYTYVTDTLAPALKIATEKINELQRVKAKLEGTVKAQKAEINNEKVRTVYYQDKYFSAVTKTDTLGNSDLDYTYNAVIDIATVNKPRFLKKDVQEIYITSPDRNFKVNGVEHYKQSVTIPRKNFSIGLQVGYGITESGFSPYVGLGGQFNLINIPSKK